ncbi:hypothetical protein Rhe02_73040 [Rhizocola hellebori]|uniref:LamG-like jellyroll fold domain-containing protein n=1 Tax=Rhizocola hellebori TaxID=1392758 RepID=A0A8J3VK73_9ACTN|nr:hypothetical protein Rhe02_73040 [Rhizocola hellebori]
MLAAGAIIKGSPGDTEKLQLASTACLTPPDGIVSWWTGDGSGTDIVGGNDSTNFGADFGAGLVDQAYHLAGGGPSAAYFTAPAAPEFAAATQYSVEFWFRPIIEIAPGHLSAYLLLANGQENSIGLSNGDTRLELRGPLPRAYSDSLTWQAGVWHHVGLTYQNPGGYRLFLDGVLVGTTAETLSILAGASILHFGWIFVSYGNPDSFPGDLDEITMYSRALGDAEIAAVHTAGSAGKCKQSSYPFAGFFSPVDNLPVVNSMRAGRAVPVKFSLGADLGLNVLSAGYPKSEQVACDSSALVDGVEETLTAGGSSLAYNPITGQYSYVWKTNNDWSGTCRQLVVKLTDGSMHRANFQFN